ncbi:hypothetical protein D3C87_1516420 [compost metagenome]
MILDFVSPLINLLGYSYYVENLDFMKEITDSTKAGEGFSIYLFLLIDLIIILFYNKLKIVYGHYNFIKFYNLFFIGVILSRIFSDNFILARIADYFIFFRVLILAFLMFYIFNLMKNANEKIIKLLGILIILGMFFFYCKAIYNNAAGVAPFQFYFNHD